MKERKAQFQDLMESFPTTLGLSAGLLHPHAPDILGQVILCCGGFLVHSRMFSGILISTYQMPVVSSDNVICPLEGKIILC